MTAFAMTSSYFDASRLPMGLESEEITPLLQLFLESAQDSLVVITRLASSSSLDKPSLKHALHAFKGACMTVGALYLADLTKSMESQIEAGHDFDKLAWLSALETAIRETASAMGLAPGASP